MTLTNAQKSALLELRVSAIEKMLEEMTGAYSGLLLNHVEQNTTDAAIIAESDKIKPVKVKHD